MSLFISPEGHDLNVVYRREDCSYVIDGGLYHVPNEGEYAGFWDYVNTYVNEHPEALSADPEPAAETFTFSEEETDSVEARLADIEDALVELAGMLAGGE